MIWKKYKQDKEAKLKNNKFKLPIIFPLVMYNGKIKYNAPTNIWQLFENPQLAQDIMANDYHLIDLHSMSDENIDNQKYINM